MHYLLLFAEHYLPLFAKRYLVLFATNIVVTTLLASALGTAAPLRPCGRDLLGDAHVPCRASLPGETVARKLAATVFWSLAKSW